MKNSTTFTASVPNTKKKNWRDEIIDADSCIKAILIGHDIRELKKQVENGDDNPQIHKKIKQMAEEYKELALKGYANKRNANQYLNY